VQNATSSPFLVVINDTQFYRTLEEGEVKSMRCKEKEEEKEDRDDLNAISL
jgi:hypothetical protein